MGHISDIITFMEKRGKTAATEVFTGQRVLLRWLFGSLRAGKAFVPFYFHRRRRWSVLRDCRRRPAFSFAERSASIFLAAAFRCFWGCLSLSLYKARREEYAPAPVDYMTPRASLTRRIIAIVEARARGVARAP